MTDSFSEALLGIYSWLNDISVHGFSGNIIQNKSYKVKQMCSHLPLHGLHHGVLAFVLCSIEAGAQERALFSSLGATLCLMENRPFLSHVSLCFSCHFVWVSGVSHM